METLDLRKIPCPKNTSKAIIFLATAESGEKIRILVDDGEPIANVPSSLEIEGHKVLEQVQSPEGFWSIVLLVA